LKDVKHGIINFAGANRDVKMPAARGDTPPFQQMICSHTSIAVSLLGRPVDGQAAAHNRGQPANVFKLNHRQGKQSPCTYCHQCMIQIATPEQQSIWIIDYRLTYPVANLQPTS